MTMTRPVGGSPAMNASRSGGRYRSCTERSMARDVAKRTPLGASPERRVVRDQCSEGGGGGVFGGGVFFFFESAGISGRVPSGAGTPTFAPFGSGSPKITRAFAGRLRTAVGQSVGAACLLAGTFG